MGYESDYQAVYPIWGFGLYVHPVGDCQKYVHPTEDSAVYGDSGGDSGTDWGLI